MNRMLRQPHNRVDHRQEYEIYGMRRKLKPYQVHRVKSMLEMLDLYSVAYNGCAAGLGKVRLAPLS